MAFSPTRHVRIYTHVETYMRRGFEMVLSGFVRSDVGLLLSTFLPTPCPCIIPVYSCLPK
jgi:hypothetical protein